MCDLDSSGVSSTLRVILSVPVLARMLPTLDRSSEDKTVCLKWNWPLVDYATGRTSNSRHKSDGRGGVVIIIRAIFSNFVSGNLIQ